MEESMTFWELQGLNIEGYYCTHHQLMNDVYKNTQSAIVHGCELRAEINTEEKLLARIQTVREAFWEGMGGKPTHLTPLSVQKTGILQKNGWHIEKLIMESRPSTYITANLYLPDDISEPRAAVLMACGHAKEAKAYPEYQEVCQKLLRKGFVVLCFDPIGQGERVSYLEKGFGNNEFVRWGTDEHDYAGWQIMMAGESLAKLFLEDAMCALTYLSSRPEVDKNRVGMTGNSGGGMQTCLMMLMDERLAAAAPGTFVTSRADYMIAGGAQDMEQIWYGVERVGFDHADMLLGMHGKPVCVLAVKYDFFPIEGTRKSVKQAQEVLNRLGIKKNIKLIEDTALHAFTPALADASAVFFAEVLSETHEIPQMRIQPLSAEELNCTKTGSVKNEFADSCIVFDETKRLLKKAQHATAEEMRKQVFFDRKPCQTNLRIIDQRNIDDLKVELGFYFVQEDIANSGLMFRSRIQDGKTLPLTVAVWDDGSASLCQHSAFICNECRSGRAVFVLNVSSMGTLAQAPINAHQADARWGALHKLATDLLFNGDSLPAVRTYDILRCFDAMRDWPNIDATQVKLYSRGICSLYAHFAAKIDSRIQKIDSDYDKTDYLNQMTQKYYSTDRIHEYAMPGLVRYL